MLRVPKVVEELAMKRYIVIRAADGEVVGECAGPDARGQCPRVALGEVVPCAGQSLTADGHGSWLPYAVPGDETTCPVALALALAASPDALPALPPAPARPALAR